MKSISELNLKTDEYKSKLFEMENSLNKKKIKYKKIKLLF